MSKFSATITGVSIEIEDAHRTAAELKDLGIQALKEAFDLETEVQKLHPRESQTAMGFHTERDTDRPYKQLTPEL